MRARTPVSVTAPACARAFVGFLVLCESACARAHACARACAYAYTDTPIPRTTCVHPYVCAFAQCVLCVRACSCESGGVRAAVGVVYAWLRVAMRVRLRDRKGVRVAPHADRHIGARVRDRVNRACVRLCVQYRIAAVPSRPATARRAPTAAQHSDRPPHPISAFACTSAPCASSAAATSACPFIAALWSGVYLQRNAHARTLQRASRRCVYVGTCACACACARVCACACESGVCTCVCLCVRACAC